MSNDIVSRLRSYTDGCIYSDVDCDLIEAADEIERLRKRVAVLEELHLRSSTNE